MSGIAIRPQIQIIKTVGEINMVVNKNGVDRPGTVASGNPEPYLTLQAAIDALPKIIDHEVNISITNDVFEGAVISGFVGGGEIKICGTYVEDTSITGASSGQAGAGTSTQSLRKPAAAADWTADELRGKFLVVTAGGGASTDTLLPSVRCFNSNTTNATSHYGLTGLNSTSTFQISVCGTELTKITGSDRALEVSDCQLPFTVQGMKFSDDTCIWGLLSQRNQTVRVIGCDFPENVFSGASSYDNKLGQIYYCWVNGAFGAVECIGTDSASLAGLVIDQGSSYIDGAKDAFVQATARTSANMNAFMVRNSNKLTIGASADSCSVTPFSFQNINECSAVLTGTNSACTIVIDVSKSGQYSIAGSTVTGVNSDCISLEGRPTSYSELSSNGTLMERGTFLHWASGRLKLLSGLRVGYVGGDELIIDGDVVTSGQHKLYGFDFGLGDADANGITAHAGGGQADATVCGYRFTTVTTAASAGDSIKLRQPPASGAWGIIQNNTGASVDLYPHVGGEINSLGANNAIAVGAGQWAIWKSTSSGAFLVKII